jgi:hypothetical protein
MLYYSFLVIGFPICMSCRIKRIITHNLYKLVNTMLIKSMTTFKIIHSLYIVMNCTHTTTICYFQNDMCVEDVFKLSPLPALKFEFDEISNPEQEVRIGHNK